MRSKAMVLGLSGVLLAASAGWLVFADGSRQSGAAASQAMPADDSAQATPLAASSSPSADASDASAQQRFLSEVAGLVITPVAAIPAAAPSPDNAPCGGLAPSSAEARAMAAQGWIITSDHKAGPYRLIAAVGREQAGTSGTCLRGDGRIALFQNGQIRALVQEQSPAGDQPTRIASLDPLDQGGFRLFDGDYLGQAVAGLQIGSDGSVRIIPQAKVDTACGGRARVPNLYNLPINRAHDVLARHGWVPAGGQGQNGVPAPEDCAGTGLGFCNYAYQGAQGRLTVTTAGEADYPPVVGYGVECTGQAGGAG